MMATGEFRPTTSKKRNELPTDWRIRKIGDVCQIFGRIGFRGYTVDDIVSKGQGAISLSPSNVKDAKLTLAKNTYISWEKWEESPEIKIVNGDIILVKTGSTVGKAAIVRGLHEPATLNPQMVVFKKRRINETLLGYVVTSEGFQTQLAATAVGGALPTLSQKEVAGYSFACPDDPLEQEAIAEALTDADGLVEGLERLIAKKRRIKQGAMQDLLTAKRRLPGFSGEWVERRLGELLTVRHGRSQKHVESPAGIYPILATGGRIGFATNFLWDKPSVLIGRKGTIDRPQFMEKPFWTVDTLFYTDIKSPNDAKFLFCVFQRIDWRAYNEASGVPSLNASTIEAINVLIPDANEQIAIASVANDMDAEITTLETRLQKARAIKEGMMQNLLTGRIRLV